MYKKILKKINSLYNEKTFRKEDSIVLKYIDNLKIGNDKIDYFEVGSGLCRFASIIKNRYRNYNLRCLEKNDDLVNFGLKMGLNVVRGDIMEIDFLDQTFDIIHCSHVLEHLDYESIVKSLDEMFRVLKTGGYLIIRSPLMYDGFYFDIDHVRPYPPEAVLNYFNNNQQQKVSGYNVSEIARWYRHEAPLFFNSNGGVIKIINYISKFFWLFTDIPKSKPNGYILILKKN